MIINSIDSPASKYYYDYNREAIFYNILIADSVKVTVNAVWADVLLTDLDTWNDDKIYATFTKVFDNDKNETNKKGLERFKELSDMLKKARHLKIRNKETTQVFALYKKYINDFKWNLKAFKDDFLTSNHINEMMPFLDERIWQMIPIDYKPGPNKEDGLIQPMVNTFLEPGNIFYIDGQFVAQFSPATYISTQTDDFELIKVPLWNFPHFADITYQQIKYTRDNLQPGLHQFKERLKEISDKLSQICFSVENFQQISQLFNSRFFESVETVQKLIDDSLYINKLKNQFKENTGSRFCLGITSPEGVVRSFERTETIQPYVASEIKFRIEKEIDLTSSYIFTFIESIESNPLPYA